MSSLRFEILKTKIVKGEGNRAGLHAKIAEPPPIFCKDSQSDGQSKIYFSDCRETTLSEQVFFG